MTNNNVQNVRFLRNGTLFTSREEATSALTNFTLTSEMDGSSILARYQVGTDPIKTLVGYVYYKDASNNSVTIFDVDNASSDVDKKILSAIQALDADVTSSDGKNVQVKVTEEDGKITAVNITTDNTVNSGDVNTAITNAINELDYTDSAVPGQYVSQVSQADGKIAVVRVDLPTVDAISAAGKPITAVSENLGAISATAGAINAEFVNIADSGQKFTAKTVEDALAEIATEIDAMDLDVVSGDGEVITAVSEKDGKVSASKTAIKDVKLTGYVKNTAATGAISGNDDIEDALSKLENTIGSNAITNADGSITVAPANGSTEVKVHIKSDERVIKLDGNGGGIYTDIKIASATPTSTTVKEEYNLLDSNGNALGTSIKIYKDSHIVSITYITDSGSTHYQNLEYKYIDADGVEKTEYVDISSLVLEAEFASGVTFSNGVAHGVVDPTSENFLTVGADGFKVDGIKGEIDTKINALDATVGSTSVESGKHVAVQVVEDAGKLTALTVTETDIASASALTAEIAARKAVDGQNGDTYSANTNANYISGATSLNDADIKLNDALASLDTDVIKSVKVNDVKLAGTSNAVNVQISSVKASGTDSSPIVVNTDDNTGAVTLQILQIDCGEY